MKIFKALALTCAAVFLTGCIKIHIAQQIHADGTADIEIVYDVKGFFEASIAIGAGMESEVSDAEYAQAMAEAEAEFATICDDDEWSESAELPESVSVIGCEYLGEFRFKITGKADLTKEEGFEMIPQNDGSMLYRISVVDISDGYNIGEQSSSSEEEDIMGELFGSNPDAQEVENPFSTTLTLTLPGEITRADFGTITGRSTVVIDLMGEQPAANHVIESILEGAAQSHVTPKYGSKEDKRKERICLRVKRYSADAKMLERINRRLGKRFGFTCTALDF